jgi:Rrf2 family nitric oxide-sensitive transcriptional repressor
VRLARPAERIGLGDVVRRTEEDFDMVECFAADTDRCAVSGACRLKGALARALAAYLAVLDEYTLADLTRRNTPLARLLQPA